MGYYKYPTPPLYDHFWDNSELNFWNPELIHPWKSRLGSPEDPPLATIQARFHFSHFSIVLHRFSLLHHNIISSNPLQCVARVNTPVSITSHSHCFCEFSNAKHVIIAFFFSRILTLEASQSPNNIFDSPRLITLTKPSSLLFTSSNHISHLKSSSYQPYPLWTIYSRLIPQIRSTTFHIGYGFIPIQISNLFHRLNIFSIN